MRKRISISIAFVFGLIIAFSWPVIAQTVVKVAGSTNTGSTVVLKVNADGTLAGTASTLQTGAKGGTTAGTVTSSNVSTARQPLDVTLYDQAGNPVTTFGSTTVGSNGYVKTGAPSFSVSTSTVSAAATALTAGACYQVGCSTTTYFRTGTGTPTALTTDNPFFGPAIYRLCIPSTDTAVAFVTAAGTGTCVGTLSSNTP